MRPRTLSALLGLLTLLLGLTQTAPAQSFTVFDAANGSARPFLLTSPYSINAGRESRDLRIGLEPLQHQRPWSFNKAGCAITRLSKRGALLRIVAIAHIYRLCCLLYDNTYIIIWLLDSWVQGVVLGLPSA